MHNRKDGLSLNRHGQRCVKTYLEALLMVFMQDGGDDDGDEMGLVCRCTGSLRAWRLLILMSLMSEMYPRLRREMYPRLSRERDSEMGW